MFTTLLLAATQSTIAFVGVDVLPLDADRRLTDQTLIVRGDRIVALGASAVVSVPDEAEVIEARGKTLMPGLCDMHVHLRHAEEDALLDYLAAGVTCVREMNGRPRLLEWRSRIRAGELLGPDLFIACPTIGNWSSPKEGFPTPKTADAARETVRKFFAQGYDWIKFYSFVPRDAFLALVDEAHVQGVPAGGHVPVGVSLTEALDAGVTSIEHLTGYLDAAMTDASRVLDEEDLRAVFHAGELDSGRLDVAIRATVSSGVWNCPTVIYFDRILPTEMVRAAWRNPKLREAGERNRRLILERLHRAGARLLVGTDSDAGDDLAAATIHDEFQAMADAGMKPFAVLQAATVHAAESLGRTSDFGSIAVGKRADLLLVSGDPRDDLGCLREPELVVARGRIAVRR